ncbi:MAG: Lon protease family protein [Oligoflexus sp.]
MSAGSRRKKTSSKKSSQKLPLALKHTEVYRPCALSQFHFNTTKELPISHDIIAQDRAIRAINVGLGIRRPGYNIYVAGIEGTGKTSVIQTFLQKWSQDAPAPNDWVYLYNFADTERPQAIEMPRGQGRKFKKQMEHLVRTFRSEIPRGLQSEDYENAVNAYFSAANETKSKLYSDLEKLARAKSFMIKSTRVGIETIPVIDGRPLSEKDYSKLSEKEREDIENGRSEFEPEVLDFARKVRAIDKETREHVEELRNALGEQIVSSLMEPLQEEYASHAAITQFLKDMLEDVKEHLLDFAEEESEEEESHHPEEKDRFHRYRVNVVIDNSATQGAPIVIENNPTYYNLFGKIEKNVEHGMYLTDFTMIKPGSIHRANGGYLVLNALDIFRAGNIWDTLKRVLRNRKGFIEDMGEQYSLLPTSGLRPDPIPLDLKVVMIGTEEVYRILFHEDEEFHKIFKIKADFDFKMDRNEANMSSYVSFIATRSHLEGLLPFNRSGVAAIIEYGSRRVEDQNLLSTQFGEIKDLTIEADFFAREQGAKVIKRENVEEALNQKYYRLNLQEQNLLEMIENGDLLVEVDEAIVGQINGLAVYDYGDYSFGKIGRITCTSSVGDGHLINIERQSELSGNIHDKGVLILNGILNHLVAQKRKSSLNASVCFEQSYGLIDGDSASAAELIAVISSLSGIPVKQSIAITGSINQLGQIQAIGGINEKIEGFFNIAQLIGREDEYGVVIPQSNVRNLMLHNKARDAVKSGYLKIYPVSHLWQAFEIITGVPLGCYQLPITEPVAPGSAIDMIHQRLEGIVTQHVRDLKRAQILEESEINQ